MTFKHKAATLAAAVLLVAGCVPRIHDVFDIDAGAGATLDAQQRIVLVTHRGGPHHDRLIACAEPSPDAMSAIAGAISASGGNGQVQAALGAGLSQTAAYIGLRTPTIQLLRDGLYRACEGYLNGVLNRESYELILRNYDRVMVALLAIDAAGGFPHPPAFQVTGGNVTVNNAGGTPAAPPPPPGGTAATAPAGAAAAPPQAKASPVVHLAAGLKPEPVPAVGAGDPAPDGPPAAPAGKDHAADAPPPVSINGGGGSVVAGNNSGGGINNADQVMKTVADYMLDNSKWLTAVCLTALEQIGRSTPAPAVPAPGWPMITSTYADEAQADLVRDCNRIILHSTQNARLGTSRLFKDEAAVLPQRQLARRRRK